MGGCCHSDLAALTLENTPELEFDGQSFETKVLEVYDGDTVTVAVRIAGDGAYRRTRCRLAGIDAAEVRTRNSLEKAVGRDAKEWLSDLVLNKVVYLQCGKWDKFGRLLGTLYLTKRDVAIGASVNAQLVRMGYAYTYGGEKKRAFGEWHQISK